MNINSEHISTFNTDGILKFDSGISFELIDRGIKEVEDIWASNKVWKKLTYIDSNRIQDAWILSPSIREIALSHSILNIVEKLYGKKPKPFQTLNFKKGTEQEIHSDTIHFNSKPFGSMCGVWLALEDVGINQGPLEYYKGSHNLKECNMEDLNLNPNHKNYRYYTEHIKKLIQENEYSKSFGLLKKGEAIIWKANLLHGGSFQIDKKLTRKSMVTHFYFEGDYYWNPLTSKKKNAKKVNPKWIKPENSYAYYIANRNIIGNYKKMLKNKIKKVMKNHL